MKIRLAKNGTGPDTKQFCSPLSLSLWPSRFHVRASCVMVAGIQARRWPRMRRSEHLAIITSHHTVEEAVT